MSKSFPVRAAVIFVCLISIIGCTTCPPPASQTTRNTYVLVHGAWGGGWDWKHMDDLLTASGGKVYRPTLTGLGEHSNFSNTNIDLDTHIQDIVNVILWENLHDVVLVGQSYGGMVITGVADRVPDRIKRLVYIDALLPENGENVNTIIPLPYKQPVKDSYVTCPWVTDNPPPHDVPMPAKAFSEPITLTNQTTAWKLPATYILAVPKGMQPEQADFYRFYQRAKERGWTVATLEGDHNLHRSHPHQLAKLIERAP